MKNGLLKIIERKYIKTQVTDNFSLRQRQFDYAGNRHACLSADSLGKSVLSFLKDRFYPVSDIEITDIPMKKSGFRNDELMSLIFYWLITELALIYSNAAVHIQISLSGLLLI